MIEIYLQLITNPYNPKDDVQHKDLSSLKIVVICNKTKLTVLSNYNITNISKQLEENYFLSDIIISFFLYFNEWQLHSFRLEMLFFYC